MFGGLYSIIFTDYTGSNQDLTFLQQANWLQNAAVTPRVFCKTGEWFIGLTYVWTESRFRFLCRYIPETFKSEEKAKLFANMYKRTAQKDKRGELIFTKNDFNINYN